MVFSKEQTQVALRIYNNFVEQVSAFRYLGALMSNSYHSMKEVLSRIKKAKSTFIDNKNFFIKRDLDLNLRIRMLRCYVFPILRYSCESWILNPHSRNTHWVINFSIKWLFIYISSTTRENIMAVTSASAK